MVRSQIVARGRLGITQRINQNSHRISRETRQSFTPGSISMYEPQDAMVNMVSETSGNRIIQNARRQPLREIQNVSHEHDDNVGDGPFFIAPSNLMNEFKKTLKGSNIFGKIRDYNVPLTHDLECQAVNFAMDLLLQSNGGKLNFGTEKIEILHNVAKSLIITFPRLKNEIRRNENPLWQHVNIQTFSYAYKN